MVDDFLKFSKSLTVPGEIYSGPFKEQPIGRPGDRAEVSGLVIFLLSDQSSYITGHEHVIDGGRTVW